MRGETAEVGAEREAPNGYRYVKTADRGWVLKHWLIWEKSHGRLVDSTKETVRFVDGNKRNLSPGNITVVPKGKARIRRRMAQVEDRIREYKAELEYLESQLAR